MNASVTPAKPSALLAMHARFEAAWDEYSIVDEAKTALGQKSDLGLILGYATGLRENNHESELLRHAVLHQVPSTDEELTVLAFHAWGLFDYDQNTQDDHRALGQALNSIFDYLVGEGRADEEGMGRQFATGAMLAQNRRRCRTGLLGQEA